MKKFGDKVTKFVNNRTKRKQEKREQKSEVVGRDEFAELHRQLDEVKKQLDEAQAKEITELQEKLEVARKNNTEWFDWCKKKINELKRKFKADIGKVKEEAIKETKLSGTQKELDRASKLLNEKKLQLTRLQGVMTQILESIETEKSLMEYWNDNVIILPPTSIDSEVPEETNESKSSLEKPNIMDIPLLICVGNTGLGKSTFLNRFCGDISEDGDEIQNGFLVGDDINSCTSQISRKLVVHIDSKQQEGRLPSGKESPPAAVVAVEHDEKDEKDQKQEKEVLKTKYWCVDTPGTLDSESRDVAHKKNVANFLKGCGGVTAFLVFISLPGKLDSTYEDLLAYYSDLLKDGPWPWWNNVILVCTKRDLFLYKSKTKIKKLAQKENKNIADVQNEEVEKRMKEIRAELFKKKRLNIPQDDRILPCVSCGHDNFNACIDKLKDLVEQIKRKFDCKEIQNELTHLEKTALEQEEIIVTAEREVKHLEEQKKHLQECVASLKQDLGIVQG